jgi:hypothetical protein
MAVAAKVRPADLAAKLCSVEPLEHRQLLSAVYGGGWAASRAHAPEPVARSAAVTVERMHANLNADATGLATGRGENAWSARPGQTPGVGRTPQAALGRVRQTWSSAGDDDNDDDDVAPAGRFGRTAAEADAGLGSKSSAGGDGVAAQPAAVAVKHTVEVVGQEVVLRTAQGLQRVFVPLGVVDRTEVVTQSAGSSGNGAGAGAAAAARAPQWRGQASAANEPQHEEPEGEESAVGTVSAQYVSRNLAGGTDISPHLAQASDGAVRMQLAAGAQAVVQGVVGTSTAAVAAATRAAGDVLAGAPASQAAVAGAVEGAVAVGGVARAAMLGSAQGFFWVAMAAVSDQGDPSQYVPAAATLTAAQVATERAAAVTSKVARVAAAAEQVLPAAVEAAVGHLVPGRFIHIPRVDALASFNDAMLAFIDDSAMMPKPVNHSRTRAWAVTVVVIAADVALLVHWHRGRWKHRQATARPGVAHKAFA